MLTESGRRLIKAASYIDTLNTAAGRMLGRLARGTFRLGWKGLRTGAPLAGRLGIAGVKEMGRTLQWGSDWAARRPALALSAAGMPAAYALTKHSPERLEAFNDYSDPHSAAAYRIGLLRNTIVSNPR